MKKKVLLALVTVVLLLSIMLSGCGATGVPQADYDNVAAQLADAQSRLTKAQSDLAALQADKSAVAADLQAAQAEITDLEKQVSDLEKQVSDLVEQYELTGATKAETVEKIVKYYSKTHFYEKDVYDCNNMAADVSDMLRAINIHSVLAVGNINGVVSDIFSSNHAWLMAEVAPGEYLALEATGGMVVPRSKNQLYYNGWYFEDTRVFNEYIVKIDMHNLLVAEDADVIAEHDQSTNQQAAEKLEAIHYKLIEMLDQLEVDINALAKSISTLGQ